MNDYNKPPLGVKPAELHAEERAKELADAISRNILDGNFYYCKMWVDELKTQIEIAKRFKPIEFIGLHKTNEETPARCEEESEVEE